ncbi:FO synthase subunit 1 [Xenococcus sp. PCC 7305]|uniref:7,8-didemethyl-8-hydroxy-5-deazariboflavin synthase subunit CofG n=1 Tax=Xenococcus sp. PCC 7305 TaxID=102125 RepID=UPI0002ABC7A7|nr:7,8-didemethyl-8-hydroxy-5-deazariboflavin synthase subunit CofG [Xenococcus sp. PCC 7305]ELS05567.1 FO synthase subunit 1 [Xenococcus sp. PCC 7305]
MRSNPRITYSPAYTVIPTYECFNRCSYCNFRKDIGSGTKLTLADARKTLTELSLTGISEILILSGEVPLDSTLRQEWFARIRELCELALSLDLLPHSNVGILSWDEMRQLKEINVSMGLMLEQITPKLLSTVHKQAPSKRPELRLQQLAWAGELKIPFTTGLLLGIGETAVDREKTLEEIASLQQSWGHIQEVILQPHSQGTQQSYEQSEFNLTQLPEVVAIAKKILPDSITIQIPPNLISQPKLLLECLEAGARDLGGISPKDEVNPDYPHPTAESLRRILEPEGWQLITRLPVYPQYLSWLSDSLRSKIERRQRA